MSETQPAQKSPAAAVVALSLSVPAVLGAYPVMLALDGMAFRPPGWIAVSWQLASVVTWAVIAVPLLALIRLRTDANATTGRPPLVLAVDGPSLSPVLSSALVVHAVTIASASSFLGLGRARPPFLDLALDVLLLYAPMNVMTLTGLIGAAILAAESRARGAEMALRLDLERQLQGARREVVDTLALLNGPAPTETAVSSGGTLERITVTSGNRTIIVPVDDIDWIEARSYYARLHVGSRDFLVRQSMNALEQRLDPQRFARIHRSTIVNLERVVELQPYDRRSYVVTLRDGRRLMMSRRRRRLLEYLLP